jgi:hypothetical protein
VLDSFLIAEVISNTLKLDLSFKRPLDFSITGFVSMIEIYGIRNAINAILL